MSIQTATTHLDPTVGTTRRHSSLTTTLGELLVVVDGQAVVGLYFPGHWYPPAADRLGPPVAEADDPVVSDVGAQLRAYLAGDRQDFDLAVATDGDEFSERVWALLCRIPYGQTTTYGALAEQLGSRTLAQRVGQAVGHNPISIIIPCHRVVGADGALTGYAGGLSRKRALLDLEEPAQVRASRLF